ncbi:MAG: DUF4010 domain-containing protein [Deltaproteobacteria bacterium]|nr:DUF4010 domain-containing protein [Deltaproteobacteria bacterium]
MDLRQTFLSLGIALAAGALIGAERQQAQEKRARVDFGGIRTFPLISLAGALGALMIPVAGLWVLGILLAGLGALLTVSHARAVMEKEPGISTEVAALITFALGALAAMPEVLPGSGRYLLIAAVAAVVMALLALKQPLHGFAARVSADDVYATSKFVILALVVLPILPDRAYGPFAVLNPYTIGLMIVLVAGLSFAGYVGARAFGGRRGLILTGLLGGLVSSTAVTLTFSGRAKEEPSIMTLCSLAIVVASATMFARVLAIVAVVDRPLLGAITWPMAAMGASGFGAALWLYRREADKGTKHEVPLRNPFELRQAVKFGLAYAAILFIAKAAQATFGSSGVYVSAFLAGLTDVDAIVLSISQLHREGLAEMPAATGITLAVTTNTLVKAGIAAVLGGPALGKRVGTILVAVLAAGGVALAIGAAV